MAEVYSTDSQIKQYGLTVLEDDQNLFPPYQAAPMMNESLLKKYPELKRILNQLSGEITAQQMIEMNYEVNVNQASPEKVAREFLKKNGLI